MKRPLRVKPADLRIWSDRERRAWRLPESLTVSECADRKRILDERFSAEPGTWRTERNPAMREIMDAFGDPMVERITLMAAAQVGKTEVILCSLCYIVDQDPGPVMIVMPTEDAARHMARRIESMLRSSPELDKHIVGRSYNMQTLEFNLDTMTIYFAWATSPTSLSSKPCRYIFLDEVDKYPKFSGDEADPVSMAEVRTRTYSSAKKIVQTSTPTTRYGYIYKSFEASDRRHLELPCALCGQYQVLRMGTAISDGGLKWPGGMTGGQIKREDAAWYQCEYCKEKLTDAHIKRMARLGKWATAGRGARNILVDSSHRGFARNCFGVPWITLSEIAAEFMAGRDSVARLMNFRNSWEGEIWEEKTEETLPNFLATLAGEYAASTVPAGAIVLTAGVDVQKANFFITIRAWGYFEESWLIRAISVETWEQVHAVVMDTVYPRSESMSDGLMVQMACIDSGYRTNEVYSFCRERRGVCRPVKGQNALSGAPFRASIIDRHPRTGRVLTGGLALWHVDTSFYKDKISRMIHAQAGDPAQFHLHAEPRQDYLEQMCSEHKVLIRNKKNGTISFAWEPAGLGAANHYFDTEVYSFAASGMLRLELMRPTEEDSARSGREDTRKPEGTTGKVSKYSAMRRHGPGAVHRRTG